MPEPLLVRPVARGQRRPHLGVGAVIRGLLAPGRRPPRPSRPPARSPIRGCAASATVDLVPAQRRPTASPRRPASLGRPGTAGRPRPPWRTAVRRCTPPAPAPPPGVERVEPRERPVDHAATLPPPPPHTPALHPRRAAAAPAGPGAAGQLGRAGVRRVGRWRGAARVRARRPGSAAGRVRRRPRRALPGRAARPPAGAHRLRAGRPGPARPGRPLGRAALAALDGVDLPAITGLDPAVAAQRASPSWTREPVEDLRVDAEDGYRGADEDGTSLAAAEAVRADLAARHRAAVRRDPGQVAGAGHPAARGALARPVPGPLAGPRPRCSSRCRR